LRRCAQSASALKLAAVAVFVVAVALVPLALDSFQAYQFALVGVFFIAITGLNVLTGYTGQISLGHGAFMAVGGYSTAILVVDHGFDPVWTIPLGGLVAGLAGFLFGIPALRLSGLYLAIATFGVAVATPAILRKFDGFTGGSGGKILPLPKAKWGLPLGPNDWLYYLTWTIALVLLAAAWALLRGRTGRAFRAVRDSEVAATAFGVHLPTVKTLAFGVSAFYAGVAGSLYAIVLAFVSPDTFSLALSIRLVVGAVASGLGSLWGLPFGAALVEFLPVKAAEISRTAPDVIFGAVLIAVMLLLPTGAAGLLRRLGTALTGSLSGRH
jgi:branched-chain amino acid transport system permease protein